MTLVEVVTCDRCRHTIFRSDQAEPKAPVIELRIVGQTRRDLCTVCSGELEVFLRGVPVLSKETMAHRSDDADQLAEVRRVANAAIERYADGATADEMIEVVRDVASAARRR